ncbi:hypothetical protein A2415_01075 [candidate division WWE3 bacterium RIFOXYC1_FULL_39_7]|uniref:Uncharacterized protein n=1 Tax=candidate division WWE3 bacterium RIFOXYC1_FULL_39_7 TaxID=1802643 RepID=A0A1F4WIC3_UNCKA|nr:MAG: hypothetical protein A2415_01075 [candidate division WWE3 bacterium RIFOXYC1_FULL_39_7]
MIGKQFTYEEIKGLAGDDRVIYSNNKPGDNAIICEATVKGVASNNIILELDDRNMADGPIITATAAIAHWENLFHFESE